MSAGVGIKASTSTLAEDATDSSSTPRVRHPPDRNRSTTFLNALSVVCSTSLITG
jgi:hypothetical protein